MLSQENQDELVARLQAITVPLIKNEAEGRMIAEEIIGNLTAITLLSRATIAQLEAIAMYAGFLSAIGIKMEAALSLTVFAKKLLGKDD